MSKTGSATEPKRFNTFEAIAKLLTIYLIVAIPFKVMEIIPGFTDVRPVLMLTAIFPVFYGVLGCGIMAVGNLIMDIISDSLRWSSIAGFIANFVGPLIIYLVYVRRAKRSFSLRTPRELLGFSGTIILAALVDTIIITPAVAITYPEVDAGLFALAVMLNDSVFPIVFGIPIVILMQEEPGFEPLAGYARRVKLSDE